MRPITGSRSTMSTFPKQRIRSGYEWRWLAWTGEPIATGTSDRMAPTPWRCCSTSSFPSSGVWSATCLRRLMGWSMGGYGALLAAERARAQFVAVAPASPAIWLTPGATAPGAFDSPADFYANDIFDDLGPLRGMAIAVACGTSDPFYMATTALVSRMDYPHSVFFGPGSHDATYWASVAPDQLRAIAPAFP